ncbi:MAG: DUF1501 domain-containing protein [Bacteroidetes bacterium]|nr:DUF1501 domain-containing protein [Bacteroidota bacterium]MDA1120585.1 DUF1501 domain-containing protein [Bacteroidota bacterium]
MKRRTFLHRASHALAAPAVMGSFGFTSSRRFSSFLRAQAESGKVLVLIYLQGGNDGLNTVIPLDQLSALNLVRPHVILPENKLLPISGTELAFHPALDGFSTLYKEGKLKIIQSVGYPEQNYSHFRSTDIWMSGSDSDQLVSSGWPGRYLNHEYPDYPEGFPNATDPDPLSIEIGYGSSMLFQGPATSMSMVLKDPTSFHELIDNVEEESPDTYAGDKLKHIRLTARQSQLYGEVVKQAANKVTSQQHYPDNNELAQQLKIVARLISGGLKTPLYMVRLGGFDTHAAQVMASDHTLGEHASLLADLDNAVKAFMNDIEFMGLGDNVLGMTFSEFGRRIISNASLGTDHGAAAPLFVFGNQVEKGVLGTNPVIPAAATFKDNLPWQFDFRQVYGSVLEQWFGMQLQDRASVLMSDFSTLPIIGEDVITAVRPDVEQSRLKVYPNPVAEMATIDFISSGAPMKIEAIDMLGRPVGHIFSGVLAHGNQSLQWNTRELPAGNYYVLMQSESTRRTVGVVKLN